MRENLSAARLREVLNYDATTGDFTRRVSSGYRGCHKAGSAAGSINSLGYVCIGVDGAKYSAHRLAWLYVHGEWPFGVIDHINGDRSDNRIVNLRDISQALNLQNQRRSRKDNTSSGLLGVERRGKRFRSRIQIDGHVVPLGNFDTAESAHAAYVLAKRAIHSGGTL